MPANQTISQSISQAVSQPVYIVFSQALLAFQTVNELIERVAVKWKDEPGKSFDSNIEGRVLPSSPISTGEGDNMDDVFTYRDLCLEHPLGHCSRQGILSMWKWDINALRADENLLDTLRRQEVPTTMAKFERNFFLPNYHDANTNSTVPPSADALLAIFHLDGDLTAEKKFRNLRSSSLRFAAEASAQSSTAILETWERQALAELKTYQNDEFDIYFRYFFCSLTDRSSKGCFHVT